MNRLKLSLFSCVLATVLAALFLTAGGTGVAPQSCGMWHLVPSPNPGSSPTLNAVAAVSDKNVWAVGGDGKTLIEHWNGTSWQVIPSPGSHGATLADVAVVTASDIWAVGNTFNSGGITQTLTEHWNGTSWQVIKSPNIGSSYNFLLGVVVVSTKDIWAVGIYFNNGIQQTLTEHWDGTSWQVVPSPNVGSSANYLYKVAAVSTTDVWAVGNAGSNATLIEHWDGTNWQVVQSPSPGASGNFLNGVAAVSAGDIWTVGISIDSRGIQQTLTEHWNGTSWQVIKSLGPGSTTNALEGVAVISAHSVWAVGAFYNNTGIQRTLTEHWNGTTWQIVPSPNLGNSVNNALISAAHVPGSSEIWSVGSTFFGEGSSQTITEVFC